MFLAKKAKICHWFPATAAVPWDVKVNNAWFRHHRHLPWSETQKEGRKKPQNAPPPLETKEQWIFWVKVWCFNKFHNSFWGLLNNHPEEKENFFTKSLPFCLESLKPSKIFWAFWLATIYRDGLPSTQKPSQWSFVRQIPYKKNNNPT